MATVVRPARDSDLGLIVAFNQAMALATEGTALDEQRLTAGVRRALADPGRGVYSIAEVDDRAVGCLMVTREWSDWRDGWIWWIQSVFVDPAVRGRGVYRALHDDVLARARRAGDVRGVRLYVEQENDVAQAVYAACGMSRSRYVLFGQGLEAGAGL